MTPAEEEELAALEQEFSGLTTAEAAELATLEAEVGGTTTVGVGVPQEQDFISELAATPIADLPAPESTQPALQQLSGSLGRGISDVGGVIGENLVGLAAGGLDAAGVDVPASLGTPESRATGSAAIQAVPIGAGVGFATALLGRTKTAAKLALSGNKLVKGVGNVLTRAGKNPVTTAGIEGGISGVSVGAGEGVVQASDTEDARLPVELGTAIIAPALAPKFLKNKMAYMVQEDSVDTLFANYLRENPAIHARAEANLADFSSQRLQFRLDTIAKDQNLTAQTALLGQKRPDLLNLSQQVEIQASDTLRNVVGGITDGSMTPAQASKYVDDWIATVDDQAEALNRTVPNPTGDTATNSMEFFNKKIDTVYSAMKEEIDSAYAGLSTNIALPDKGKGLLDALPSISKTHSPSGAAFKKSGAKEHVDDIIRDFDTKGFKPTGAYINEIRGNVLKDIRERGVQGKDTSRLRELEKTLTGYLDTMPELQQANTLYRTFKDSFDKRFMAQFFRSTKDQPRSVSSENFYKKMLAGSPVRNAKDLKRFVEQSGAKHGTDWEDVQQFAREGFLIDLRSTGLGKDKWTSWVAKNKATLNEYGIADEFADYASTIKKVVAQKDSITDQAVNRMVLNKYGVHDDPSALRRSIVNNKAEFVKTVESMPKHLQASARAAGLKSMLFDGAGELLDATKINSAIITHGKALGVSPKAQRQISTAVAVLAPVGKKGVTFPEFDYALKRNPDLGDKIKAIVLERITRPAYKVLRGGASTLQFLNEKETVTALKEALLTEEGARKIVKLAGESPQSRTVLAGLLYGRAAAISNIEEGEQ